MGSCTNKWRVAELDVYIYIIEMGKCGHGKLYK